MQQLVCKLIRDVSMELERCLSSAMRPSLRCFLNSISAELVTQSRERLSRHGTNSKQWKYRQDSNVYKTFDTKVRWIANVSKRQPGYWPYNHLSRQLHPTSKSWSKVPTQSRRILGSVLVGTATEILSH